MVDRRLTFNVEHDASDSPARTATVTLPARPNGPESVSASLVIQTPAFMPVATQAAIKGVEPQALADSGTQMVLANTYHLMSRPGEKVIRKLGGLHLFMNWSGGIITDSGGFQVYSLSKKRHIDDQGVTFQHHIDGCNIRLEPETALEIQRALGSDIAMVLDECIALPASREETARAMERTLKWACQSRLVWETWRSQEAWHPQVFGIGQGGSDLGLRQTSMQALRELDFPGYAIGGLAVGEEKATAAEVVKASVSSMPAEKPRYLMGVGTPSDLVRYVGMGVDLFDCVLPTRNARNGQLFTRNGKVVISHARYAEDSEPVDPECCCPVCRQYTRAYLRHLFLAKEILASVFNTIHNLYFYQELMENLRTAIRQDRLAAFSARFFELQAAGGSD